MRHLLLASVLALITTPAMADKLSIDRIFDGGDLSGPTPRALKMSPDGTRVTFIRARPDDQHTFDLWQYKLADKTLSKLVDASELEPDGEQLSRAELARRERARTAGLHGIISYQWSHDGHTLLFPLNGKLYLYDLDSDKDKAVRPLDTGPGEVLDPRISPAGGYVSWVREQNLWVMNLKTGAVRQLTMDGHGTVHNGQAEFVAQEEMERQSGYWWAPDDSAIAYEQYDEAPVPVTQRFEIYADHTTLVEQRYPFAGDPNVTVKLGLVAPEGGDTRWIDLGSDADMYLTRVKWLPGAKRLSYQWMARSQQKLELRLVDAASLAQRVLLTETSNTWVDLHKDLRFLENSDAFIWGSDRSGFHHLYLYGLDGKLRHAISAGDWNLDSVLAVDEKAGLVYVDSNRDFVPDRQVYALKLDGSSADAPTRISTRDGMHQAVFATDASVYLDTFASPTTPPQVSLHQADGTFITWIEQNKLQPGHPYWPYHDDHIVPEFGTLKADDGQLLYYRIYKPAHFDPGKKYPVFDTYYGGPHGQVVTRGWVDYFAEYMAQQGFVVFSLDNRGMARRGRQFSDAIYQQFGVAEVADQVKGIQWLKSQPWVDGKRIGVFGWSYGGYMTTMLLAKDSADIAGGVAVAPVTDWSLYDTFYTERYLGRPLDNEAGYRRSAPFAWLDGLKSPLLLMHGMADDNVLFLNSTKLMAALQERGIQFDLMTYPGAKHGLNLPGQRAHAFHRIADFFQHTIAGECDQGCAKDPEQSQEAQQPEATPASGASSP